MSRASISRLAHRHHPIAAPVSTPRARALLDRLPLPGGGRVLDLGCGFGAWLLLLAEVHPTATAVGVDLTIPDELRAETLERGWQDRLEWVETDAAHWDDAGEYDAVLSIGATHAFGGLAATLASVRDRHKRGGAVLLGNMVWDRPPDRRAREAVGVDADTPVDLSAAVSTVCAAGYEVLHAHLSTPEEWHDYEWSWTGSLIDWATREGTGEEARFALEVARRHRTRWIDGYRDALGFVTFVLTDLHASGARS